MNANATGPDQGKPPRNRANDEIAGGAPAKSADAREQDPRPPEEAAGLAACHGDHGGAKQPFRRQDWPFYWITQVSNLYVQTMETRLKAIDLDVPGWRVLMCLREDGHLGISEIAERSVIKLNTATKIVRRMEEQGLVVTRPRPEDLRVTEVTLTHDGEVRRCKARTIAETIYETAFADLTPDEQRQMNSLMARVFVRLDTL